MRTKTMGTVGILALAFGAMIGSIASAAPSACYTTNCTGSDVNNRRDCYLCCSDKCVGTSLETNCQEDCDAAWLRVLDRAFPQSFGNYIIASKHNPQAQREILTDIELWDWMIEDGFVSPIVLEIADWFVQNAASEAIERLAVVNLAWLAQEHRIDDEGRAIVKAGLRASLYSASDSVRVGALLGLREAGFALNDSSLAIEMIRMVANDPSEKVRAMGVAVISKMRNK